ncbi:MAG: uroporphyrinogen-III synthase [Hyphomicrobiales bacterium]
MRVLITRPEPDASLSAERLRAAGYEVLVAPMLKTVFSKKPLDDEQKTDLVVTSRNGVRVLADIASEQMRADRILYTVGDATAALAHEAGFKNIRSSAGTVDQLVDLIGLPNLKDNKKLIYVCGRDRKGGLEDKLQAKGWRVDVAVRYHANCVDHFSADVLNAIKDQKIDAVLFYSNRTAEAFNALVERIKLSQSTNLLSYFCLAKSIQSVFDREEGMQLYVAEQPNEQSLFAALAFYQGDK